jgi:hypothetical protein
MFQKVENIGGKATCQDDWKTFHIMRFSQYNAWSDQMIKSYKKDIESAKNQGRNLLTEKYGYMMEYTAPEYYKKELEARLPKVDEEKKDMISEVITYLIDCEKEMAADYPALSKIGRNSEDDSDGYTSVKTYLIGELQTYSKETLKYYLKYIRQNKLAEVNTALLTKETMVKMYGYDSIEDAEQKIKF